MSKKVSVSWLYENLPRDIYRSVIIVVAVEVIRHYLKPKDRTIEVVDHLIGDTDWNQQEYG